MSERVLGQSVQAWVPAGVISAQHEQELLDNQCEQEF